MGSVYQQDGTWYLRFKKLNGRWSGKSTKARTKTEAKSLLTELEREIEMQRAGLAAAPNELGTFRELMEWWLANYSKGTASHERNELVVNRHLVLSPLADLSADEVTAGRIETLLKQKEEALGAQSINHLRQFIIRAYNAARSIGKFTGENPAKAVKKRKIPKRKPDYLAVDEVPPVLAALRPQDRPLFATAIYTGLRKGELFGLLKTDIDFKAGLLTRRALARPRHDEGRQRRSAAHRRAARAILAYGYRSVG